ncbi:PepSY domain-containing protein [Nitrospira sp. M1]
MNTMRHFKQRRFGLSLLVGLGIIILTSGTAPAAQSHEQVKTNMAQSARITIDQAIQTATQEVPGTVIKAELEQEHGPLMWEIEVVASDGKIHEVHIDGTSGKRLALDSSHEAHHASEEGIHAGSVDKGSATMPEQNMKPATTEEKTPKMQP